MVVGIATSGRTPYVLGAVEEAKALGAFTIGLACNRPSLLGELVDLEIAPLVGPEVLAGSTRLKAGTATKLVLNTLTTGAMVLIGKTLGNRMVDLQPTNEKLRIRTRRISPGTRRDRRRRGRSAARPLLGPAQASTRLPPSPGSSRLRCRRLA